MTTVVWVYKGETVSIEEPDRCAGDLIEYHYCPTCGAIWLTRVPIVEKPRHMYVPIPCRQCREWIVPFWYCLQTYSEMEEQFDPLELQALETLINTPDNFPNEKHSELHR